jgi:DNA-binding cell septation regulator SpoVG
MLEIKVVDVRRVNGEGKLAGFADVELGGVMLVKGFGIVKGPRPGTVFVHPPRKTGDAGRWFDIIIFNPEFWDRLEPLILDAYALEVEK